MGNPRSGCNKPQCAVGAIRTLTWLYIEAWCNGNTTDFDSVVVGSSPAASATWRNSEVVTRGAANA